MSIHGNWSKAQRLLDPPSYPKDTFVSQKLDFLEIDGQRVQETPLPVHYVFQNRYRGREEGQHIQGQHF